MATGGAAAPVLIGAAVGAGVSTGVTVVTGVINGDSPADIAKAASDSFMWGAIGGAVGGGTTQLLGKVGTKVIGKVGKKVIEEGVDMALELTETATENGGLTGQDILLCAATSFGGELLSSVKTPSTVRNQLVDGVADNKAVKNAVTDSVTDNKAVKNAVTDSDYGAHDVIQYEKLKSSYAANEIVNADRVGSGLKSDPYHRAASFVPEEQLANGRTFEFTNGDGRKMTMLQTEGEVNGKTGIFEYILNPDGQVEHQLFKPGAGIIGPNP